MKNLIKKLLRERLEEAIKHPHYKNERYMERISDEVNNFQLDYHRKYPKLYGKRFNTVTDDLRVKIDERLDFIQSLEFDENDEYRIGIWAFISPKPIRYWPYRKIDKGHLLMVVISKNQMLTLFWEHEYKIRKENQDGKKVYHIYFNQLEDFVKSEYYDPKTKPISAKSFHDWKMRNEPDDEEKNKPNPTRFSKEKLSDGEKIRYYYNVSDVNDMFKTLDGQQTLNVDDIFDKLPEKIQNKVFGLMENKKK